MLQCTEKINNVLNGFIEDNIEPLYELSDGTLGGRDALIEDQKAQIKVLIANFVQAGDTKEEIIHSIKKWLEETVSEFGQIKLTIDYSKQSDQTETDILLDQTDDEAENMGKVVSDSSKSMSSLFHAVVGRAKHLAESFIGSKSKQEVDALINQLQTLLQEVEKNNRRISNLEEDISQKDLTIDELRAKNKEIDNTHRLKENDLNQQIFELIKKSKSLETEKQEGSDKIRGLEQIVRQLKADSMREAENLKNAAQSTADAIQNSLKVLFTNNIRKV